MPPEIRSALRNVVRQPGVSLVVVVTLALAIGANTAIASFVAGILLARPPYREPERLVRLESLRGGEAGEVSLREVSDFEEQLEAFSGIAVHSGDAGYNVSGEGRPEELPAILTSGNLFEVLGVPFLHGGPWPAEYDRKRNHSVVLSHGVWHRRWGGDPGAVGSQITLDGAPGYTIYGVLPPGFDYPVGSDLFRSVAFYDLDAEDRSARYYRAVARLAPGVSLARARQELEALAGRLAASYPETNRGVSYRVRPLADVFVGALRPYLLLVAAAVGLVLAIAGANVVNLLLGRAAARQREIALRSALGAGRGRLARQLLLESLLLALAGGALGLALAAVWVRGLAALLAVELPVWTRIEIGGGVLAFTAALTVGVGLLSGLLPALQTSRPAPGSLLKEGARGSAGGRRGRLRRALVAGEVALALVLVAGAGLLVKSFGRLAAADLGYEPEGLLTFKVALGWKAYEEEARVRAFYEQLLERLATLPGVVGVATNSNPPLGGDERRTFAVEGQTVPEQQANPYVDRQRVSHGYHQLLGIPLLRGRLLREEDQPKAPLAAVINQRLAERLWPGGDPIGKRLKFLAGDWPWLTVVGVVGNVRHRDPADEAGFDVYFSAAQLPDLNATVLLRTSVPPETLVQAATEAVWATDPDQSNYEVATLGERLAERTWQLRISRTLFSLFGALAVSLAAVGIYGVMAYSVRQRRREMGIRLALGARRATLLRQVLGEVLALTATGAAIGLALALLAGRLVAGLLYGVSAADPPTLGAVLAFLAAVALAAGYLPARRAAATEPVETLREE
jgi:predicted permease